MHSSYMRFVHFQYFNQSFDLCLTMAKDYAERILNIFVISHGFVTLNFRHNWRRWQSVLFVLAVCFSAFGFLREAGNFVFGYSERERFRKDILGSAIFWGKLVGDAWGGFAVTWGIVWHKKMAKARSILEKIDNSLAQLEGRRIYRRTQWHMKVFFMLQILLVALRIVFSVYVIIKEPNSLQWQFIFDAIYKNGIISVYYFYISFIYHKIYLRYREINQMLLRPKEIDVQSQLAKTVTLAEMRKLTGKVLIVINSFYAIPVSG